MAKVGALTLESGKIIDNAINQFFAPAADKKSITMTNSSGGPNLIYVTGNSPYVWRESDGQYLFQGSGYTVAFAIDEAPGASETYWTLETITGGVVRLK